MCVGLLFAGCEGIHRAAPEQMHGRGMPCSSGQAGRGGNCFISVDGGASVAGLHQGMGPLSDACWPCLFCFTPKQEVLLEGSALRRPLQQWRMLAEAGFGLTVAADLGQTDGAKAMAGLWGSTGVRKGSMPQELLQSGTAESHPVQSCWKIESISVPSPNILRSSTHGSFWRCPWELSASSLLLIAPLHPSMRCSPPLLLSIAARRGGLQPWRLREEINMCAEQVCVCARLVPLVSCLLLAKEGDFYLSRKKAKELKARRGAALQASSSVHGRLCCCGQKAAKEERLSHPQRRLQSSLSLPAEPSQLDSVAGSSAAGATELLKGILILFSLCCFHALRLLSIDIFKV